MNEVAQHSSNEVMEYSVDSLLFPIGENQVGDDPRYSDDFTAVKLEIDKLSKTDYLKIAKLCEQILLQEAKDLRVAGYYLLSKVFIYGIKGLIDGIELYCGLLRRYGANCHPQRPSAQAQAIAWLNNDKLSFFIKKIDLSNDEAEQASVEVKARLETLNQLVVSLFGSEVGIWTSINPWIDKIQLNKTSVQTELKSAEEFKTQSQKNAFIKIDSELAFARTQIHLLDYIAERKDIARLIATARALKWSSVSLPENTDGVTKIQSPRKAVIDTVRLAKENANESKLIELESYYMETGCHFYLDLQVMEIDVARNVGRDDLAEMIEMSLQQIVQRLPEIVNLKYIDGMPFANDSTKKKLTQIITNEPIQIYAQSYGASNNIKQKIDDLLQKVDGSSLTAVIDKLSELSTCDKSEAFRLELELLNQCIEAGRADVALPLGRKLEKQVESYRLAEWDKALALELWNKMLLILQSAGSNDESIKIHIEEIKEKISATDIGLALQLF